MVVAEAQLIPSRLRENPEMAARVLNVVRVALDRRRFPWVIDQREATPAEKNATIIASAALLATSRVPFKVDGVCSQNGKNRTPGENEH
jgi:hypothetical protein